MRNATFGLGLTLSVAAAASAEDRPSLQEYIASMNWAPVSFAGQISAEGGGRRTVFTFIPEGSSHDFFFAVIDAGREVRERIETNCETGFGFSRNRTPCRVEGTGTVEFRASQIFLSIQSVTALDYAR